MTKLLLIETSARGAHSVSRNMARRFTQAWMQAHQNGEIIKRDLMETALQFTDSPWLQAYFAPPATLSTEMKAVLQLSDELVAELIAADHVVIATPVYNYHVPAVLKAWIDHIVRKGITLGFDGRGLLTGKKATVLIASGGIYTEGSPIDERDLVPGYLRLILEVIGITDVTIVAGGGAKAVDLGEMTMDSFLNRLDTQLVAAAQT